MSAQHVAYVANGAVSLEERTLQASDFSEADRGVANVAEGAAGGDGALSAEEQAALKLAEKVAREEERRLQKRRSAAPKKLAQLEEKIGAAEAQLEALGAEMLAAGSDASRAVELSQQQAAVQARIDGMYEEWEELEELLGAVA